MGSSALPAFAACIRLRCPAWSAPIVGTKAIIRPARRAAATAARVSLIVLAT
jgi:hypothetical protein